MIKEVLEILLDEAIKAYSAKGGELAREFPYSKKMENVIIKNINLRKNLFGYRTFSLSEKLWNKYFEDGYSEIGNINIEKGLTSFTKDEHMLNRFRGGNEVTIVIKIKLKKYLDITKKSIYPEEQEVLGYNTKWKVTKIDNKKHGWFIIGEEI